MRKKTMAYNMHNKRYPDNMIDDLLEVSAETIKQWFNIDIQTVK